MPFSNEANINSSGLAEERPNFIYYFLIGLGDWTGIFRFTITSWRMFWADPIGLKNRFLALSMSTSTRLFGPGRITSRLEGFPDQGKAGVVTNYVRISKFGVTIYLLREQYNLDPDGRHVQVRSRERFGPIPFLFNVKKEHPAEILDSGMQAIYYMPLLGTEWVAQYTVREDRRHIDSHMSCSWADAQEVIDRVR